MRTNYEAPAAAPRLRRLLVRLLFALALLAGCGADSSPEGGIGTLVWEDGARDAHPAGVVAHDVAGGVVAVDAVDGRVMRRLGWDDASALAFDPWRSALWAVEGQRILALDDAATLTWASPESWLVPLHDGLLAGDAERWRGLASSGRLLDSGRLPTAYSLSSPRGRHLYALQQDGSGARFVRMRALGSEVEPPERLWRRTPRAVPALAYPLLSRRSAPDANLLPATVLAWTAPGGVTLEVVDGRGAVLASAAVPTRRASLLDLVATPTRRSWRAWLLLGGRTSELVTLDWGTDMRVERLELPAATGSAARVLGERLGVTSAERVLVAADDALVAVERDPDHGWQLDEEFVGKHLRPPFAVLR